MVPALKISLKQVAFIVCSSSVGTIGFYMGIASSWAFPVPFGLVLICSPFVMMLGFFFIVSLGRDRFEKNPVLVRQLQQQISIIVGQCIIVGQASLCMVYPGFGAIYNALPSTYQPIFTFLLPVLKIILSNSAAYVARDAVENLPGITLMSVKDFNALYVAKCMQNSGSRMTYVVILAFDMFESVMVYRDI